MEIILKSFVYVFLIISIIMNIKYFINIFKSNNYIKTKLDNNMEITDNVSMLILIPVLREPNIIVVSILKI